MFTHACKFVVVAVSVTALRLAPFPFQSFLPALSTPEELFHCKADMIFCHERGKEVIGKWQFCANCGTRIAADRSNGLSTSSSSSAAAPLPLRHGSNRPTFGMSRSTVRPAPMSFGDFMRSRPAAARQPKSKPLKPIKPNTTAVDSRRRQKTTDSKAHVFRYARNERSYFTLGTRAEDNFAQLEKISCPILNIETVFVPNHLSAKWFSTPSRSLHA